MTFITKLGILALLRNQLRLNDVTFTMHSLLVVLRSDGMMWICDTAHLTDIGSKTEYRTLTSLEMSRNLLIHHVGS